jgi:hypothetical protein
MKYCILKELEKWIISVAFFRKWNRNLHFNGVKNKSCMLDAVSAFKRCNLKEVSFCSQMEDVNL